MSGGLAKLSIARGSGGTAACGGALGARIMAISSRTANPRSAVSIAWRLVAMGVWLMVGFLTLGCGLFAALVG